VVSSSQLLSENIVARGYGVSLVNQEITKAEYDQIREFESLIFSL
jgi:hypothetical protein